MTALVTTDQLQARLPFTMNADELREASGALEDLSDEARYYGSELWDTPNGSPYPVKNLILKAASRHMKNYDGFIQSRAGDETVQWGDHYGEDAGSATFTKLERERLAEMAGVRLPNFVSVGTFAYQRKLHPSQVGQVPDEASNEPIQMFSTEEPW